MTYTPKISFFGRVLKTFEYFTVIIEDGDVPFKFNSVIKSQVKWWLRPFVNVDWYVVD